MNTEILWHFAVGPTWKLSAAGRLSPRLILYDDDDDDDDDDEIKVPVNCTAHVRKAELSFLQTHILQYTTAFQLLICMYNFLYAYTQNFTYIAVYCLQGKQKFYCNTALSAVMLALRQYRLNWIVLVPCRGGPTKQSRMSYPSTCITYTFLNSRIIIISLPVHLFPLRLINNE